MAFPPNDDLQLDGLCREAARYQDSSPPRRRKCFFATKRSCRTASALNELCALVADRPRSSVLDEADRLQLSADTVKNSSIEMSPNDLPKSHRARTLRCQRTPGVIRRVRGKGSQQNAWPLQASGDRLELRGAQQLPIDQWPVQQAD